MGLEVNPLSLISKSKVVLENIEHYSVQVYLSCKFEEVPGTLRVVYFDLYFGAAHEYKCCFWRSCNYFCIVLSKDYQSAGAS
jgi:hypothetical protein